MTAQRQLTVSLNADWRAGLAMAGRSVAQGLKTRRYQGETLNFESSAAFFGQLTERRWDLVHRLQGAGPVSLREAARRVGRDVRRVHDDVHALIALGLLEKAESGDIVCPFGSIHIDMRLKPVNPANLAKPANAAHGPSQRLQAA
jgi:predicted transcriptional regulator